MTQERETERGDIFWAAIRLVPKKIRPDVETIYWLVRRLQLSNKAERQLVEALWFEHKTMPMSALMSNQGDSEHILFMKSVCRLVIIYQFERSWLDSLFSSFAAESDKTYVSINQTMRWLYGTGEVISLMLGNIFRLSKKDIRSASLMARAASYLQLLVDLDANSQRHQTHFSQPEMERFRLAQLDPVTTHAQADDFKAFVHAELKLYSGWQERAERDLNSLPKAIRPALRLLIDSLRWQAGQLANDPLVVYRKPPQPTSTKLKFLRLMHRFD